MQPSFIPFEQTLVKATLQKRYKRFLADVTLENGDTVVAHCANSGSMMGLAEPGSTIYLSSNTNPKAKLDWRWELVAAPESLVGINTSRPNRYVENWVSNDAIPELTGYSGLKREVKYGENSRIDLLLEDESRPPCYVEVKNVTLESDGRALFPDAKTARGTKHLSELAAMVQKGSRSVMFYLVHRSDCTSFGLARDIDPLYANAFLSARAQGVEMLVYACDVSADGVALAKPLDIVLG